MPGCRPHLWRVPEAGDGGLICEDCGRYLDREADITPNMRVSIVAGVERRMGPEVADQFRGWFGYGPRRAEYR